MARLGTIYVELSLDDKNFKQRLSEIKEGSVATAKGIEQSWKYLGGQSDAMFDQQRKSAQNAYNLIKTSATSSASDIARAQEALASRIDSINEAQHGKQVGFIEKMKSNWIAATVAIGAAMAALSKGWDLASQAADYLEQMQLLDALAKKYDTTSASITDSIRKAGDGMISMSKAAEVAASGLAKGITPKQLTDLAGAAATMADFMGVKVEDAFQQFSKALETGRTRSITAAVGITEMTNATEEMTEKMTPAVKAQAAYNAIMEASAKVQAQLGEGTESIADKFEKLSVAMADLKIEMGVGLIRAGAGAAAAFEYLAAGVLGLVAAYAKFRALVYDVKAATTFGKMSQEAKALADEMRAVAEAAGGAKGELIKKAAENFGILTASTQQLTTAANAGKVALQEQAKAVETQYQSVAKVIPIIERWGEVNLKLAQSKYAESLKVEAATIEQLRAGLESYLAVLTQVYEKRIEGEKAIAEYAQAGKSTEDVQKANEAALKTEQAYAQSRLDAWKQYYDTLAGQHKAATDKMKAVTKELADMEKAQRDQAQAHANTMMGLQTKLLQAQGKAASDVSIYQLKLQAIEEERAKAQQLSGQEQVAALEKVKAKYGELTGEVTTSSKVWDSTAQKYVDNSKTIITAEEAIKTAIQNVASVQNDIVAANEKLLAAKEAEKQKTEEAAAKMQTAMNDAKTKMGEYEALVIKIAGELDKLSREIAITVNDQASGPIAQIAQRLADLKDKTITVTVKEVAGAGGAAAAAVPSGGTSGGYDYVPGVGELGGLSWESFGSATTPSVPSYTETYTPPPTNYEITEGYAKGLQYVPRDNFPARLHEGEAVLTKDQATKWRSGASQTINFNPSISIAADHRSAEEIARQIVKPLQNEMRRLKAIAA